MQKYLVLVAAAVLVACDDDRPTGADAALVDAMKSPDVAADQATPADSADASPDAPLPGDAPLPPDGAVDAALDAPADDAAPDGPTPDAATADAMTDAADDLGARCTPGATRACYGGPAGTSGVGRCRGGLQICTPAGAYDPACLGEQLPAAMEICRNAVDDDCDGTVDEGCEECSLGATRSCYTGPAGTPGRGRCRAGTQRCDPDRRWPTACAEEVLPGAETCNNEDDDCNGTPDDGAAGAACTLANASATCRAGACAVAACASGFGDCDATVANGCEVALAATAAHCGACGNACGAGQTCAAGRCTGGPGGDLTAGFGHVCAVLPGGRVACWGVNTFGQLGNGANVARTAPVLVSGLTDAVDVESGVGASHVCAIRSGGAVVCWGGNMGSQLGDGTNTTRLTPVAVAGLSDAAQLALGAQHTCALRRTGRVVCWGANSNGQLGDGTTSTRLVPTEVLGLPDATQVVAGRVHTCALRATGAVVCWGANASGQLGDGSFVTRLLPAAVGVTGAVALAAGAAYTCAIRGGGVVSCWGANTHGQLGDGARGAGRASALDVPGLADADQLALGDTHTCVRRRGGTISCWGGNVSGALGDGTFTDRLAPVAVAGVADIVQVVAGVDSTCARRSSGAVSCWGAGGTGQLGDGRTGERARGDRDVFGIPAPAPCSGAGCALPLALGLGFSCALRPGGAVACWGSNSSGQLGDGGTVTRSAPHPVNLTGAATHIAAGFDHACARLATGGVRCWGSNTYGQLGDGATTLRPTPVAVTGLADAEEVVTGTYHSCARSRDGAVLCWGRNNDGQLGDGSTLNRGLPGPVGGGASPVSDATAVGASATHACAIRAGGAVWCWGNNAFGQLGDGTLTSRALPVPVRAADGALGGLTGATQIAVGSGHVCALRSGSVACWGRNVEGELGDGTTLGRQTPVTVPGLIDAVALRAGILHTCALRSSGAIVCWGHNLNAELGDGSLVTRSTPTPVVGISDAVTLALGGVHTCARRASGAVSCWGLRTGGALGDGTVNFSGAVETTLTAQGSVFGLP